MRAVRRLGVCTAVSLAVAGLSLPAAFAQSSPPTTPIPGPAEPGQPPASMPTPAPGPVVADAGTMVGIVRILPNTVPTDSILDDPDFESKLPKQSVAEAGMGRAIAQANSTAFFATERAVAEASPFGVSLLGKTPQTPVGLVQAALPDREQPTSANMQPPSSPADQLVKLNGLNGSVHARWSEKTGPCVSPIADARYSMGSASAVNALPEGLSLGGLLNGGKPAANGAGSLLRIPETAEAHSNVQLVNVPGQDRKAVQATSSLQLAGVRLFAGTPQEIQVDVVGSPRLTATATGDPSTSTVDYQVPVLRVSRGGQELGKLDAAHPNLDVPLPGLDQRVVDAGVIRLSAGELKKDVVGTEVRAAARLFDLQILRGHAVGLPTSLVQVSFGEQIARAAAPDGGVDCTTAPAPAAAAPAGTTPQAVERLALTSSGYYVVPLFWTGTALLLMGAIIIAVLPRRRA
ncbi:hypothetical protein OU415_05225 [Saccharopolyspora sp. WRP15-2]|uniref:Uncharacterized protein n=1 Tax=Saccharopolyspora oryzae TaxID=2997343 RepID=A0ABT4UTG1_9PSEU|nr:hypothetical protein [Saccharopolyspora oryzae]MDA3624828.1 hypothetical protein [Saccharopolyspora oryzae]